MTEAISTQDVVEKTAALLPLIETTPFLWTLDRYHRAIDAGIFQEDDKLELLFGQIVPKMPVGEAHAECVSILSVYFILKYRRKYKYRVQDPTTLPGKSEPEPDFMIVVDKPYGNKYGHPKAKDTLLVVEVSDSSLLIDRSIKARAYAFAEIAEYWIVNLKARQVEVHLEPNKDTGDFNSIHRYASGTTFESPFNGPTKVAELLPPAEQEEE